MRAELASWQTAPVTALCFGSFARGEGDEDSDVDLLLVRPIDVARSEDTWDRQQQALRDLIQRATTTARFWISTSPGCFGTWIWVIGW